MGWVRVSQRVLVRQQPTPGQRSSLRPFADRPSRQPLAGQTRPRRVAAGSRDGGSSQVPDLARLVRRHRGRTVDEMNPANAVGDPLPDVFPPDDPIARFVVSMAMASNDIERALRDVVRAGENDDADFTYRIRLSVGHLVEALDALSSYSQEFGDIRSLIKRVPRWTEAPLRGARDDSARREWRAEKRSGQHVSLSVA